MPVSASPSLPVFAGPMRPQRRRARRTESLLKDWSPAFETQDLDRLQKPLATVLHNRNLVVWRGQEGKLLAATNRCPHAGSELSMGRLQGGMLKCGYHGWEFDAAGRCAKNPYGPVPAATQRSMLEMIPAVEQDGIAWVWTGGSCPPEHGPTPLPEAFSRLPASVLRRRVPGAFVEHLLNAACVTHIHDAHAFGSHSEAGPVPYVRQTMSNHTVEVRAPKATTLFDAPSTVYHVVQQGPIEVHIWSHLTPAQPSETHHFSKIAFCANQSVPPRWRGLFDASLRLGAKLQVANHIFNLRTSEEDVAIVAHEAHQPGVWGRSDMPRRLISQWVESALPQAESWIDKDALLTPASQLGARAVDRYHQHTHDCGVCLPAYDRARLLEQAWPSVAVGLLAASAFTASQGDEVATATLAGGAFAASALGTMAGWLRRQLGPSDPPEHR